MNIKILQFEQIQPFTSFGLSGPFWAVNIETLVFTWVAMAVLFLIVGIFRLTMDNRRSMWFGVLDFTVDSFASFCVDSIGYFRYDYFAFVFALFAYALALCLVGLLPYLDEATKDPNTTFAIALVSFFFVLYQKVSQDGVGGFIMEFFHTFPTDAKGSGFYAAWAGNILFSPLEVMSRLSRIISMSFRLFGNILGGSIVFMLLVELFRSMKEYLFVFAIIVSVYWFVVFYLMNRDPNKNSITKVLNWGVHALFVMSYAQMFFGIFEAFIQAFVLVMLTITYLSSSIHHDIKKDSKGIVW